MFKANFSPGAGATKSLKIPFIMFTSLSIDAGAADCRASTFGTAAG